MEGMRMRKAGLIIEFVMEEKESEVKETQYKQIFALFVSLCLR